MRNSWVNPTAGSPLQGALLTSPGIYARAGARPFRVFNEPFRLFRVALPIVEERPCGATPSTGEGVFSSEQGRQRVSRVFRGKSRVFRRGAGSSAAEQPLPLQVRLFKTGTNFGDAVLEPPGFGNGALTILRWQPEGDPTLASLG